MTQQAMNANDAEIFEERLCALAPGDLKPSAKRKLAAGVLKQAARDLRRFRLATSEPGRELYFDAYRWLSADEFSWPFSFLNVCQALSLAPETVRAELMSELSLGSFRYWRRRIASAIALLEL